jgi:hypothetical protein
MQTLPIIVRDDLLRVTGDPIPEQRRTAAYWEQNPHPVWPRTDIDNPREMFFASQQVNVR